MKNFNKNLDKSISNKIDGIIEFLKNFKEKDSNSPIRIIDIYDYTKISDVYDYLISNVSLKCWFLILEQTEVCCFC